MTDWNMGALDDVEVAGAVDQGLASLAARTEGPPELVDAIERACDAWDAFADLLPGFRKG
jgi:hypothetical protein